MLIRSNLHALLYQLARFVATSSDQLFWCDRICIDQDNEVEKTQQVAILGRIFGNAEKVLVWLGKEENQSRQLFEVIKHRAAKYNSSPARNSNDRPVTPLPELMEEAFPGLCYDAIRCFLARKYWTRTWIVQEIWLAKDVVLLCGQDMLSWDELEKFIRFCEHYHGVLLGHEYNYCRRLIDGRTKASLWNRMNIDRSELRPEAGAGGDTISAMKYFRASNCHDTRDKIYAFLWLDREPDGTLCIEPDYNVALETAIMRLWFARGREETRNTLHNIRESFVVQISKLARIHSKLTEEPEGDGNQRLLLGPKMKP